MCIIIYSSRSTPAYNLSNFSFRTYIIKNFRVLENEQGWSLVEAKLGSPFFDSAKSLKI